MSETSGELGIAFGVAMIGSIGAAVYRGQVDVPAAVPGDAAATAAESITGAVTTATGLPTAWAATCSPAPATPSPAG